MRIKPAKNFMLVDMRDFDESNGSIELPEGKMRYPHGLVLDIGPDAKDVKIGDRVLMTPENVYGFRQSSGDVFLVPDYAVLGKYIDETA